MVYFIEFDNDLRTAGKAFNQNAVAINAESFLSKITLNKTLTFLNFKSVMMLMI